MAERRLVLTLDVGDCEYLECGDCPFRSLDYGAAFAERSDVVYRCTCPQLYPGDECPDVSEGRTLECRAAEQEASTLAALDELRECQRIFAEAVNSRDHDAAQRAQDELLEVERATLEKLREWDR